MKIFTAGLGLILVCSISGVVLAEELFERLMCTEHVPVQQSKPVDAMITLYDVYSMIQYYHIIVML